MYWSRPGSREQLAPVAGPSQPRTPAGPSTVTTPQLEHNQTGLDELADPYAVARYFKF